MTTHINTTSGESIALTDIDELQTVMADDLWMALTNDGKCHTITEEVFVVAARALGWPEDDILDNTTAGYRSYFRDGVRVFL